jgi:hypothetical protein
MKGLSRCLPPTKPVPYVQDDAASISVNNKRRLCMTLHSRSDHRWVSDRGRSYPVVQRQGEMCMAIFNHRAMDRGRTPETIVDSAQPC